MRTSRNLSRDADGRPVLSIGLHPAAEPLAFVGAGDGRLVVSARTASAGAGYHVFVSDLVRSIGADLGVEWAPPDPCSGVGDTTGHFHGADRDEVESHMLAWLRGVAERFLETGLDDAALSLKHGHRFVVDGALATPMGPRDGAWLESVVEDPRAGVDVFPWWADGTGPEYRLGRAVCRMWTDLRWRPPISDGERAALKDVAADLLAAWRVAPKLAFPWREWQEILGYLGLGGTIAEEVRDRAKAPGAPRPLGYRRGDVRVALPGAWSIRIPGALAEVVEEDAGWLAWDHRREVRFRVVEDEMVDASDVKKSSRIVDPADGEPGQLRGVCAAAGSVGVCTVAFTDPDDRAWAMETFGSIERSR